MPSSVARIAPSTQATIHHQPSARPSAAPCVVAVPHQIGEHSPSPPTAARTFGPVGLVGPGIGYDFLYWLKRRLRRRPRLRAALARRPRRVIEIPADPSPAQCRLSVF